MAAFLWTVYDRHLLHPGENPDMDEERLARLVERLEAHLDGLHVAGEAARKIAAERYAEYPEAGELFVVRMLEASLPIPVRDWTWTRCGRIWRQRRSPRRPLAADQIPPNGFASKVAGTSISLHLPALSR